MMNSDQFLTLGKHSPDCEIRDGRGHDRESQEKTGIRETLRKWPALHNTDSKEAIQYLNQYVNVRTRRLCNWRDVLGILRQAELVNLMWPLELDTVRLWVTSETSSPRTFVS